MLLVTSDKMTQYCNIHDMVTAAVFGDGAAAALITAEEQGALAVIGPSVLGTDGRGAESLIVPAGGSRCPRTAETARVKADANGNLRNQEQLYMDGTEVFNFTLSAVPAGIRRLLAEIKREKEEIDLFLLHQANGFMLEALRRSMKLKPEQLPIDIAEIGNTTSASIPILIRRLVDAATHFERYAVRSGGFWRRLLVGHDLCHNSVAARLRAESRFRTPSRQTEQAGHA